jgi:PAS domain S-box-containing protein
MPFSLVESLQPLRKCFAAVRYGGTTLLVLTSFAGLMAAGPALDRSAFLLFMPSIILSALLFDRGSGFLATALGGALTWAFFLEREGGLWPAHGSAWAALTAYSATGLFSAAVVEALRKALDRLQESGLELAARETELRRRHTLLEAIVEGTSDAVYVKDPQGRYLHINSAAAAIFGRDRGAILGHRDAELLPAEQARAIEATDRSVIEGKRPILVEEEFAGPDGAARIYLSAKAPWIAPDGAVAGLVGISRDIHERKEIELLLHQSERQKELLLRDLTHRVKNSLQVIVSLLTMRARGAADAPTREALDGAALQLTVLARLFDRLHLQRQATAVRMDEFLEGLCREAAGALIGSRPIRIETDLRPLGLDVSKAVSAGLIVNELITNALKHAYPDDRPGVIRVWLRPGEGGGHELGVADDGVAEAGSPPSPAGLGARLIESLAAQLGARRVDRRSNRGYSVTILIPQQEPPHAPG